MTPPSDEPDAGDGNDGGSPPVSVHRDVTYAERDAGAMQLDLFVPEVDDPPLVVYVHGGGWVVETRDNVPDPERYAAELGCAIASVSYRLAVIPDDLAGEIGMEVAPDNETPRGVFPDPFVDVKASIRWLRANAGRYGYDATRVATWGASAGGHLALLAGMVDDVGELAGEAFDPAALEPEVAPEASGSVQAVVDWYGAADFALAADDPADPAALLMGGPKSDREAAFVQASPVTHVSPASPPVLVMHGRADEVVPIEHSRRLVDALDDAGVDAVAYELHDLNHVWARSVEEIQSERVAMELLAAEPTPAQSVYATNHIEEGGTAEPLLEGTPPAGPAPIGQFLERTIG